MASTNPLIEILTAAENWIDAKSNDALMDVVVKEWIEAYLLRQDEEAGIARVQTFFGDQELPEQLEEFKKLLAVLEEGAFTPDLIRILRGRNFSDICADFKKIEIKYFSVLAENEEIPQLNAVRKNWHDRLNRRRPDIRYEEIKARKRKLELNNTVAALLTAAGVCAVFGAVCPPLAPLMFGIAKFCVAVAATYVVLYYIRSLIRADERCYHRNKFIETFAETNRRKLRVVNEVLSVTRKSFFGGTYQKLPSRSKSVKYRLAFELSREKFQQQYPDLDDDVALEKKYYEQLQKLKPKERNKLLSAALQVRVYLQRRQELAQRDSAPCAEEGAPPRYSEAADAVDSRSDLGDEQSGDAQSINFDPDQPPSDEPSPDYLPPDEECPLYDNSMRRPSISPA
ncbi:MAG: hypothetical protein K0U29_06780 [Gammaproteobacteria bacterium]|nr:hypothetical protein [Gammaproteobacteria bacterium]